VRLWDVDTGKQLVIYEGHTEAPMCVAVTPDGKYILSSGKEGVVRMWPLKNDKVTR